MSATEEQAAAAVEAVNIADSTAAAAAAAAEAPTADDTAATADVTAQDAVAADETAAADEEAPAADGAADADAPATDDAATDESKEAAVGDTTTVLAAETEIIDDNASEASAGDSATSPSSDKKKKKKYTCAGCDKGIKGTMSKANDKRWHPTCFVCTTCRRPFDDEGFVVEYGHAFCSDNCVDKYDLIKDPEFDKETCWGCRGTLGSKVIKIVGDLRFHSGCFRCRHCLTDLTTKDGYVASNHNPFCDEDCAKQGVCAKCKKVLDYNAVDAINKRWHASCFHCGECGKDFEEGAFNTVPSRPGKAFCDECVEAIRALKFGI